MFDADSAFTFENNLPSIFNLKKNTKANKC